MRMCVCMSVPTMTIILEVYSIYIAYCWKHTQFSFAVGIQCASSANINLRITPSVKYNIVYMLSGKFAAGTHYPMENIFWWFYRCRAVNFHIIGLVIFWNSGDKKEMVNINKEPNGTNGWFWWILHAMLNAFFLCEKFSVIFEFYYVSIIIRSVHRHKSQ